MPNTPPAPLAPFRELRARVAATVVFLANSLGFGAWAANIPALRSGLGASDAALGTALLGLALGALATMPLVGRLTGRLGTDRTTFASGLVFALVLGAVPFVPGFAGFAAVLLLLGAANGALDASMNTHAALVERRWGAAIMSSFHAAFRLRGLLSTAAIGVLFARGLGPESCLPLAGAAVVGLVLLSGPGLRVGARSAPAAEAEPSFAWPGRATLGLGLLAFLVLFAEGAVADWSALYLVDVADASRAVAASGFAAFSLAMTLGRLFGDATVQPARRRAHGPAGRAAGPGRPAAGTGAAPAGDRGARAGAAGAGLGERGAGAVHSRGGAGERGRASRRWRRWATRGCWLARR